MADMTAIEFVAASSQYLTCGDEPDYNSPYSWSAWVWFQAHATNSFVFEIAANTSNYDVVRFDAAETLRLYSRHTGSNEIASTGSTSGLSGWHHLAGVRGGTGDQDLSLYLDGVLECSGTNTSAMTDRTAAARFSLGRSYQGPTSYGNERHADWKFWTEELTAAEILLEAEQGAPVRASNLWGAWSLADLRDDSGNGRDFTATGSPVAADGPGVPHDLGSLLLVSVEAASGAGVTGTGASVGLVGTGAGVGAPTATGTGASVGLVGTGAGGDAETPTAPVDTEPSIDKRAIKENLNVSGRSTSIARNIPRDLRGKVAIADAQMRNRVMTKPKGVDKAITTAITPKPTNTVKNRVMKKTSHGARKGTSKPAKSMSKFFKG